MKRPKPVICLAADHAGFRLKAKIAAFLLKKGYLVRDFGVDSDRHKVDYPDFIIPCALAVAESEGEAAGIVFGGSGLGECLAANKVAGIRAVAAYDRYTIRMSRMHNDANILSLGGRTITAKPGVAERLVELWQKTPFSGEARHRRRLKKVSAYEISNRKSGAIKSAKSRTKRPGQG